jgi:hypothetical protein
VWGVGWSLLIVAHKLILIIVLIAGSADAAFSYFAFLYFSFK